MPTKSATQLGNNVTFMNSRIFPKTNDPANKHLLNALYQVIAHGKLLGHIKSTFSKLKLTTIKKVG